MPISGIRSSECGNRNGCTSEAASDFWCLEPACIEAAVSRFLTSDFPIPVLRRPGGCSGEPKPDPIPNSAVKLSCANGTKSRRLGRVGRCQACQGQEKIRLRNPLLFTIHHRNRTRQRCESASIPAAARFCDLPIPRHQRLEPFAERPRLLGEQPGGDLGRGGDVRGLPRRDRGL